MTPLLLWRCPICATEDALRHTLGWWRPDRLSCVGCHVTWEVRRELIGDYQLRVVGGSGASPGHAPPLSEWYDRMKAGVRLSPIADPSLALETEEVLWAKSKRVRLVHAAFPPPCRDATPDLPPRRFGSWQLFLTSRRLLWRDARTLKVLHLHRVQRVDAKMHRVLVVQYEAQIWRFRFAEESCLKWSTYIALALRHLETTYGCRTIFDQLTDICGPVG